MREERAEGREGHAAWWLVPRLQGASSGQPGAPPWVVWCLGKGGEQGATTTRQDDGDDNDDNDNRDKTTGTRQQGDPTLNSLPTLPSVPGSRGRGHNRAQSTEYSPLGRVRSSTGRRRPPRLASPRLRLHYCLSVDLPSPFIGKFSSGDLTRSRHGALPNPNPSASLPCSLPMQLAHATCLWRLVCALNLNLYLSAWDSSRCRSVWRPAVHVTKNSKREEVQRGNNQRNRPTKWSAGQPGRDPTKSQTRNTK